MFNSNRNEEGTVSAQVEITGGRIETKDFPVSETIRSRQERKLRSQAEA